MVDINYNKVEEGKEAYVDLYGHHVKVHIYEVENDRAYFRTIDCKGGQPPNGNFNRIECSRYMTILN